MAEEDIFDPLRRGVTGVATGIGDAVSGIGQGVSNAVSGVGGALGGALGGFSKMSNEDLGSLANILGRTGSALMALGQPGYNPQLRQQALMALGNVPGQVATDRFKSAQSKLMMTQMQREQRKLESIKKLDALRGTPEGIATIYKQTGFDPEFIKTADPEVLEKAVVQFALKKATMDPLKKIQLEFAKKMLADSGILAAPSAQSGAQTSGAQPTPAGGGEAPVDDVRNSPLFKFLSITDQKQAKAMLDLRPEEVKAAEKQRAETFVSREKAGQGILETASTQEYIKNAMNKVIERVNNQGFFAPETGMRANIAARIIPDYRAGLEADINTIKSNLGFGELKKMRDLSKTGGALGNISDKENELLASTIAGLKSGMSAEDLKRSMRDIRRYLDLGLRRSVKQYETKYKKRFDPSAYGGNLPVGSSVTSGDSSPQQYQVIGVRNN